MEVWVFYSYPVYYARLRPSMATNGGKMKYSGKITELLKQYLIQRTSKIPLKMFSHKLKFQYITFCLKMKLKDDDFSSHSGHYLACACCDISLVLVRSVTYHQQHRSSNTQVTGYSYEPELYLFKMHMCCTVTHSVVNYLPRKPVNPFLFHNWTLMKLW